MLKGDHICTEEWICSRLISISIIYNPKKIVATSAAQNDDHRAVPPTLASFVSAVAFAPVIPTATGALAHATDI